MSVIEGASVQGFTVNPQQIRTQNLDQPPIDVVSINPVLSDPSPQVLTTNELRANERPEILLNDQIEFKIQDSPPEPVPVSSANLNPDFLMGLTEKDTYDTFRSRALEAINQNRIFEYFGKNTCVCKKFLIGSTVLTILIFLIIFLFYYLHNK